MTQEERRQQSLAKELEKLNIRREKALAKLEKKTTAAEKVGMNISDEEWFEVRDSVTQEQGMAHLEMYSARREVADIEHRISVLTESREKVSTKVRARVESISKEEAERQKAEEIARWAEDGITVEKMDSDTIHGKTPKGKRFTIHGNHGFAQRSRHCFTLYIDCEMIFTSGEFYRAYRTVKNS